MVPLYAARVGDLKPGDFVIVECACGHSGLIHPAGLASLGLGPDDKIVDLAADSGGSRPRIRDDVAHHSDLISLGVPR
jgi:hypothetical protein